MESEPEDIEALCFSSFCNCLPNKNKEIFKRGRKEEREEGMEEGRKEEKEGRKGGREGRCEDVKRKSVSSP